MELLELLLLLPEMCGCFLDAFTALAWIVDGIAWKKGASNRSLRRKARQKGEEPPARDSWSLAVFALTILSLALTALVLWKWGRWLLR